MQLSLLDRQSDFVIKEKLYPIIINIISSVTNVTYLKKILDFYEQKQNACVSHYLWVEFRVKVLQNIYTKIIGLTLSWIHVFVITYLNKSFIHYILNRN